jgi:hypothetical protein
MKRIILFVFLICGFALFLQPVNAQNSQSAFNQIKSLAGEWKGDAAEGGQTMPLTLKYEVISGGSAVMETMGFPGSPGMVSVYYQNGDKLMMTHYCTSNNQPRLQASNFDIPERLDFQFLDISNLSSPDAEHIGGLILTFKDKDHIVQEWSHRGKGDMEDLAVEYTRVN